MSDTYFKAVHASTWFFLVLNFTACGQDTTDSIADARSSALHAKEEAIEAFLEFVDDLNAGNFEKAALVYDRDPDFHWIERGGIQYSSADAAAASLRSFNLQNGMLRMTVDQMMATDLSPTAALISTHFNLEMLDAEDNSQFSFDGWMTVAMVRRQIGWRIASGQVGPGPAQ